jgi:predicted ABC-type ATPase
VTGGRWVWLLSDPNEAGKSTYAPNLSSDVEIVKRDELAYGLSRGAPERAAVKSARLAIDRIRRLLEERRSFAVETTLSGRFHLKVVRAAAARSHELIYIMLKTIKTSGVLRQDFVLLQRRQLRVVA